MTKAHLDYESRSPVDLIKSGQYVYAEDPNTEVILAAWAIDDEPFQVWSILKGEPIPSKLKDAFLDPAVELVAQNAGFERCLSLIVGRRQGFLPDDVRNAIRDPKRWNCTAARAASCGLPRALDKVANALGLPMGKDKEGYQLMMNMCRPRGIDEDGHYLWLDDPIRIKRLGDYCIQDGVVERQIDELLPPLSEFEHDVWAVTERMNDRGIAVDNRMLNRLMSFTQDATTYLNGRMVELTNGCVPAVTNPGAIVKWLKEEHNIDEGGKIGRWIIAGLLEDQDIPAIVREVLVLRRDGGKSSTAKFKALSARMNTDYHVRGALMYAGAAATSRWSSRGAQLQNLPRGKVVKNVSGAIEAVLNPDTKLMDIEQAYGPPMVVASELVRPLFIAPKDYWLARGDYSQIESRVLAWLAGETKKIRAFEEYDIILGYNDEGKPIRQGPDLYVVGAMDILGLPVEKITENDRQVGKVAELACGFGGGMKAFQAMARIYKLKIPDEKADEAKKNWRQANKQIVSLWYDLERAAIQCVACDPGEVFNVRNGISFKRNAQVLAMRMPSGRSVCYWYPKIEQKPMPWDETDLRPCVTYYAEDSQKKIWCRHTLWGGLIAENVTQATARDIMAYALVNLDRRGMCPVLTVHDEAVCKLPKKLYPTKRDAAEAVRQVMMEAPDWAYGLPLAADASADTRYIKG